MTIHKTNYPKKLAAWLHDPAEKQLVLMRDPVGHEGGSIVAIGKELGLPTQPAMRKVNGIWKKLDYDKLKQDKSVHAADCLAAAADRPNWPRRDDVKGYQQFESVKFAKVPELIHPLSGETLHLGSLDLAIDAEHIKTVSQAHFESLIQEDDDDLRKTFLAFWRFGPELGADAEQIGALWPMLPADSRTPDHSIWSHVDTVSAIHTALAVDNDGHPDQPALLVMSFGPVQGFIGQARSTSDLWAGSHLLSSLVWEAMKPIVSHLGPDVMVFPALRGVPVVDQWLMSPEAGGDAFKQLFENIDSELLSDNTDTNPLFAASLPNKFMAIVPSKQAAALAELAIAAIRNAAKNWTIEAAELTFKTAGMALTDVTRAQIKAQLAGFPEAYWAAATWPVGQGDDYKDAISAAKQLHTALDSIHPKLKEQGVFQEATWQVLTKELKLNGLKFFEPNTGILYPAVYELAERALGAAKATRPFVPMLEEGHRCTLTGEAEWLTDTRSLPDGRSLLGASRTERASHSVWGKLAAKKPSWVKKGEHLGAIATLKRLWPTLFAKRVSDLTEGHVTRFVVSTHALALSTTMTRALQNGLDGAKLAALEELVFDQDSESATLPKSVLREVREHFKGDRALQQRAVDVFKRLPAALDALKESTQRDADGDLREFEGALQRILGAKPETYYALILMDGDRMGGWLAGNEDAYKLAYRDTWHSKVLGEMAKHESSNPTLTAYLNTKRPVSPGRHGAISQALNDFSTRLARHVVEDCCKGKLLYAGGDDVLALVAVDDLFDCMQLLRLAYSGIAPDDSMGLGERIGALRAGGSGKQRKLLLDKGFGLLDGRLMTLMGHKATASMGAVVAHHSAPLGMVMRELRAAESRAKNTPHGKDGKGDDINRDAFCLRVLKRGGGEVNVTSPWWPVADDQTPQTGQSALALMKQLAEQLALTDFSRGAIYRAQLWFEGLTDEASDCQSKTWREQMAHSLAYQFKRQTKEEKDAVGLLAHAVVNFVCDVIKPQQPRSAIDNFLVTSEFFAREARAFRPDKPVPKGKPEITGASA
ncbi:type III-B CRISPR-associated protein Cas10/Cmr2 [Rhodoferax antarcticus]|uniref:CRISPR-associated protein, Crm2 family n=1 Tax=Rhodoferax antarcticus ANT.BR TaxID=1111071 RepID=A0A1Q8YEW3_9BURK|nr:type III-B CRISPR-associated protein Cas10/Cmr2 [Rhodoferax antarcticus]APW46300.1 type III-B CRISPR-associated protein Cas10/Cmr2 [Rhodoferax antarcticus]OLP06512.1 CRISPR-associated protein, Crm2 family [Rhodoferax antarcticus ANT.BR]